MPTRTNIWIGVALLATGMLLGSLLFGGSGSDSETSDASTEHAEHADNDIDAASDEVWTCSMHPSVREEQPGSCPICGMDLIPASQTEDTGDFMLSMTETATELAQVQTSRVEEKVPTREVRLPGRIEVDERRITSVTAHVDGRIRDLNVDFTGAPIRAGQTMGTLYSPDLISAQRELLEALQHEDRRPEMVESARQKLRLWELSEEEIQRIETAGEVQTRVNITAPVSGIVLERKVAREQYVQEGSVLYEVADMSALWVVFEAYEEDLQWLSTGQPVTFHTRGQRSNTHEADITYIDPVVNPDSRTVRVRAEVSNPEGHLKPDMLVQGVIQGDAGAEQLTVPSSAVLWTGPRSLVYVHDTDADAPHFEAREVTLGPRVGSDYVITDGLEAGEHVVTHGAFRIDSEFQLADRRSMMNVEPGTGAAPDGHDHGDMDHNDMDHDDMDASEDEHDLEAPEETFQDEIPDAFRAQLTDVVSAYLAVRDALIDSDESDARARLDDLQATLDAVDMSLLDSDAHDAWMEDLTALESHLSHVDHADSLDGIRAEFNTISLVLAYSIQRFGIEGVAYRQYCPMAFDNEGAYWISDEEEIRNPYLPENMLGCGEVIERLDEG